MTNTLNLGDIYSRDILPDNGTNNLPDNQWRQLDLAELDDGAR